VESVEDVRSIALSSVTARSSVERALLPRGRFLYGARLTIHAAVLRRLPTQTKHIHLRSVVVLLFFRCYKLPNVHVTATRSAVNHGRSMEAVTEWQAGSLWC